MVPDRAPPRAGQGAAPRRPGHVPRRRRGRPDALEPRPPTPATGPARSTTRPARPASRPPPPLDPQVVVRARKNYGNALPVIFDLPPAQAVPRAAEFARYVQPVLLQSCARCHNERYPGTFQLVEIKNHPRPAEPRHRPGQPRRHAPADQPRRPVAERAALGRPGPPRAEQERDLQRPERSVLPDPGHLDQEPPARREPRGPPAGPTP